MVHRKLGIMFFLFALLSASSFRQPNAPEATITVGTIDATGAGKITVKGKDLPGKGTSPESWDPIEISLKYTPTTGDAITLATTSSAVTVTDGAFTHEFTVTATDDGASGSFKVGVKYALSTVSVPGATYTPADTDAVTFAYPTLALEYTAASASTYTVKATFEVDQEADVVATFKPTTTTEKDVPVTFAFTAATKGKVATAIVKVGAEGSAEIFKIGEKYTASFTGKYTLTGKEWTPANPLTTTYTSLLTPIDPDKKDGAKDPITVTCVNGMIKGALIEGDNKTRTLVLTEGTSTPINLAYVENKVNFTITDGQCVVSYVFNDAKIEKGKTGKAQLNLGTTAFLEGDLTFDGSKSVASIIAALLAVLAIVF
ncbi:hypothetical protein BLNAU_8500 [Blattamonas nauphoetae]|uniref:Uncharacterized protein n=1 Tax=Blattamonas nauphoetae TaxID=2049346 RepID=A0ABQ9XY75_9EUKA|nr:hypothetical protein BLNAU_8500 [Blattamonas nauphoetae]